MPLRYPLRESDFDDINNGTASPFIFRHDSDNNQTQISSSPIQEAHMVQKHSYGYPDLLSGALLQEDSTAHAGDRARSSSSSHSLASSYVELDQSQQIARTSALHQAYSTSHTSAGPVPTRQLYSKVEDMSAPTDSDGRHLAYNDVHDVDSSGAIPQAVRAWPARVSHSIHPFPQRPSTSNGTLESGVVSPQYIPFRDRSPPDYSSLTPVPLRPHGKSVPRLTPEFLPQTVLSIKSGWSSGWYGHNSADRITFECSGLNEIGVCLGDLLSGLPRDKVFQWDREFSFQYYADRQQPPQIEISIAVSLDILFGAQGRTDDVSFFCVFSGRAMAILLSRIP